MATLIDAVSKILKEGLNNGVRDARLKVDPLFEDIVQDSVSTVRDQYGRSWQALHTFVVSGAGAFRAYANSNGSDILYGETPGSALYQTGTTYDSPRAFPGLSEFVAPGFVQRTIGLKQWTGNIFMPHQILRSDKLTAAIGSMFEHTMKGTARTFAQWRANLFFQREQTYRAIGTVATVTEYDGTAHQATDKNILITLATGRVRRFQPGMIVDILDASDNTTILNKGPLTVHSVDPLNSTIRLDSIQKTGGAFYDFNGVVAAGDMLLLRNSVSAGPSGLKSWITDTGSASIYGMPLAQVPQLKSAIITNLADTLTDSTLRRITGTICDAWGPDMEPNLFITTQGVLNGYLAELDDLRQVQVNGTTVSRKGGFSKGTTFTYDGREKEFRASSLIDSGYLYGIKRDNNIKRYVPPGLPGAGTNGQVSGELEFIAPLGGVSGIWSHVIDSNGNMTDMVQAPFTMHEEYAPEVPQSLEIGGITESIGLT